MSANSLPQSQNRALYFDHDESQKPLDNAELKGRFPEFSWDIPEETLDTARDILIQLPLVHRTHVQRFSGEKPEEETLYDTPVPASYLDTGTASEEDNTFAADHELGLDRYTFLGWGGILHEESGDFLGDADYAVLVSPSILLDDKCVVTQNDVATFLPDDALYEGIGDDEHAKEAAQRYFDTAVSGRVWFEVITRRLGKAIADQTPIDIALESFGEVKYLGPIPQADIIGGMDIRSEEYDQFVKHVEEISEGLLRLQARGYIARIIDKWFDRT